MSGKETKTVMVIGDWFIDENWLMARHNSYNSSHTGDVHYLSKYSDINKPMIGLCGVPAILGILRSQMLHLNRDCLIAAFGIWNKKDDKKLKCVICKRGSEEKLALLTQYTLTSLSEIPKDDNEDHICPYDQQPCDFNSPLINLARDDKMSTNRIVRVFEGYGGGEPHILYRFDWILSPPLQNVTEEDVLEYKNLTDFIDGHRDISAIVIEDHDKGFISTELVGRIVEALKGIKRLSDTKWYIRTKRDNSPWLESLQSQFKQNNKKNIALRVLNHKLAVSKKGPRLWSFGSTLGRASLELLGEFSADVTFEDGLEKRNEGVPVQKVAILFDDNTVIAKDDTMCYRISDPPGPKQLINIGRTTVFFSALIVQDMENYGIDFGSQCRNALNSAYQWSQHRSESWKKEQLNFYGDYGSIVTIQSGLPAGGKTNQDQLYRKSWDDWNTASQKRGILEGQNTLQVWRGEGAVKGYICVGGPKEAR